jgi:hypothetical protein
MAGGCSVLGARCSQMEEDGSEVGFEFGALPTERHAVAVDRIDLPRLFPCSNLTLSKTIDRHFVIPCYPINYIPVSRPA